jgi:putative effector of murein hydrolase LrgA (UPF0299 family)
MIDRARDAVAVALATIGFFALTRFGEGLSLATHLPVPGFVFAGAIVIGLLARGPVDVRDLEPASSFLSRHLALFLIPVASGLLDQGELIANAGVPLLAVLLLSAQAGIVISGRAAQASLANGRIP